MDTLPVLAVSETDTADIREGVAVEYVSCEPSENLKEPFPEEYGGEYEVPEDEETEQA